MKTKNKDAKLTQSPFVFLRLAWSKTSKLAVTSISKVKRQFVSIKRTADEVVAIGKEVTGFWGSLRKLFGGSPKPEAAKSVAKAKKSEYVAVDETQVKTEIVKNLSEFFKLQDQCLKNT
jgi:hypothetical protein